MSTKSASIQLIECISDCPNSTNLEIANVLGWRVVTKKGTFKSNDLCIFVCIDSIFEEHPQYEFLRQKHFRVNTIKLRGNISQGIIFPLSLIKEFGNENINLNDLKIGDDVSDLIKCKHYEKPIPAQLRGQIKGHRPHWIKKTDEDNIKNNPEILQEFKNKAYVISVKVDGTSGTFYINNNEFGVCSRNLELKFDENNSFWKIANKYDIENKLKIHFPNKNIVLQGEIYGPGIQGNLLGVDEISFAAFNLFDINAQSYLNHGELVEFTNSSNIPMVKILEVGDSFGYTLEELQKMANSLTYINGNLAEGIVLRPLIETQSLVLNGRLSGKIISEQFELKYA